MAEPTADSTPTRQIVRTRCVVCPACQDTRWQVEGDASDETRAYLRCATPGCAVVVGPLLVPVDIQVLRVVEERAVDAEDASS